MRVVRGIFLFLVTLYIAFVAFMPKQELYFYLETKLKKEGIIIYNEKFKETPLELDIYNGVVDFNGVDVARFSQITLKPYLFINTLSLENAELLDLAKKALDIEIEKLQAKHTLLKPFIIDIKASGNFGSAVGYIDLKKRIVHIDITDAQNIRTLKKFLTKGEKGWYYESRF